MNIRSLIIALLIALSWVPSVSLADRYADQARAQLAEAAQALVKYNYSQTHDPIIGQYYPRRGIETYNVRLQAGMSYAIVGTCDEDCTDIDLGLYNTYGELLVRDVKQDDTPILLFNPQETDVYQLKVAIPNCRATSCIYGVGVYGQTQTSRAPIPQPGNIEVIETGTLVNLLRQNLNKFVLIDARAAQDYRKGHIPSAISLPYDQVYALSHYLPKDRSMLLVFYCWHNECGMSKTAAEAARQLGYQRVAVYAVGVRGWEQAGYQLVDDSTI